jgi:hypothetical protein
LVSRQNSLEISVDILGDSKSYHLLMLENALEKRKNLEIPVEVLKDFLSLFLRAKIQSQYVVRKVEHHPEDGIEKSLGSHCHHRHQCHWLVRFP